MMMEEIGKMLQRKEELVKELAELNQLLINKILNEDNPHWFKINWDAVKRDIGFSKT